MSEVVALLLDDAMPPDRLGALLRGARKRRGMKRKQAAAAAGTTAAKLRRYERGDEAVPADVCAQLAECYGDDLTAHVPLRVPVEIGSGDLAVGDVRQPVGTDVDDVIAGYIDIVQRLRSTGPGDPLSLRTVDIIALAGALGRDRETIEQRIAEVLGCTPAEARHLHGELLRRKVILPVAGLAAGMAAFAGVAYAAHSPSPSTRIQTQPIAATASTTSTTAPKPKPTTPPTTATPTTPPPATVPAATNPPAQSHTRQVTTPTTDEPMVDATVPATTPPPTVVPQPDPNDPPVSILPGETPITVIGTPDSTSDTP
jgi:transcriptional regulator with XRE-family HTH domain